MKVKNYIYSRDPNWILMFSICACALFFHVKAKPHWATIVETELDNTVLEYIYVPVFLLLWVPIFIIFSELIGRQFVLAGTLVGAVVGVILAMLSLVISSGFVIALESVMSAPLVFLSDSLATGTWLFGFAVGLGTALISSVRNRNEHSTDGG